jgi:hypothetical protein
MRRRMRKRANYAVTIFQSVLKAGTILAISTKSEAEWGNPLAIDSARRRG